MTLTTTTPRCAAGGTTLPTTTPTCGAGATTRESDPRYVLTEQGEDAIAAQRPIRAVLTHKGLAAVYGGPFDASRSVAAVERRRAAQEEEVA